MSLQSLLESEVISDELKLEMLTKVAENLEIPITEELIDEWELNLPGGRKLSYTKEPKMDTHDVITKAIYDKKAQSKSEGGKRTVKAPKVVDYLRRSRDTREALLNKYGRKAPEATKVPEATKAPETAEVSKTYDDTIKAAREANKVAREASKKRKEQIGKIQATIDKYKQAKGNKNSDYILKDVKMNEPMATKVGKTIKGAIKGAAEVKNDSVTAPAPVKRGKRGS